MFPSDIVDTLFAQRLALRIGELNEIGEQDPAISLAQLGIEGIIGPPEGRAIGSPGDVRIRLDVGEIWQKTRGERTTEGWELRGGIGAKGDPGIQGIAGVQGPAGLPGSLADSLRNLPSGGAARVNAGIPTTISGTGSVGSQPIPASTNLLTSLSRTQSTTNAVGQNQITGWRSEIALFWRGNQVDLGGFITRWRFAQTAFATGFRSFVGFIPDTTVPTTQPSSFLNVFGIGFDSGASQWSIIHGDAVGPATVIPLGANFNVNTTHALSIQLNADPNGNEIEYIARNLSTGIVASDTIVTNLPAPDVFLSAHEWTNSGDDGTTIPRFDLVDIVYTPPV
jgi:hypothetical protein